MLLGEPRPNTERHGEGHGTGHEALSVRKGDFMVTTWRRGRVVSAISVILVLLAVSSSAVAVADPKGPVSPQPVDRIVVRYHEGTFEVVSRIRLTMVLAPTVSLPSKGEVSGFWYELQSADGTVRYRRLLPDPTRITFEGVALTESGALKVERTESAASNRVFSVLVPAVAADDQLVLFGAPLEATQRFGGEPSRVVATLPLASEPDDARGRAK